MNIIEEVFFSKWHFITIFFSVVALLAMILGRYRVKSIMISSINAFLVNFIVVSFFIYLNVSEEPTNNTSDESTETNTEVTEQPEEVDIEERLSQVFEDNKGNVNEELVALVQPMIDGDGSASHVYVKNFHDALAFQGKVRVAIYDSRREVINDQVFDVSLEPGETKQIHSNFGDTDFSVFRYEFYPEE